MDSSIDGMIVGDDLRLPPNSPPPCDEFSGEVDFGVREDESIVIDDTAVSEIENIEEDYFLKAALSMNYEGESVGRGEKLEREIQEREDNFLDSSESWKGKWVEVAKVFEEATASGGVVDLEEKKSVVQIDEEISNILKYSGFKSFAELDTTYTMVTKKLPLTVGQELLNVIHKFGDVATRSSTRRHMRNIWASVSKRGVPLSDATIEDGMRGLKSKFVTKTMTFEHADCERFEATFEHIDPQSMVEAILGDLFGPKSKITPQLPVKNTSKVYGDFNTGEQWTEDRDLCREVFKDIVPNDFDLELIPLIFFADGTQLGR